jgi:hypothetical protein
VVARVEPTSGASYNVFVTRRGQEFAVTAGVGSTGTIRVGTFSSSANAATAIERLSKKGLSLQEMLTRQAKASIARAEGQRARASREFEEGHLQEILRQRAAEGISTPADEALEQFFGYPVYVRQRITRALDRARQIIRPKQETAENFDRIARAAVLEYLRRRPDWAPELDVGFFRRYLSQAEEAQKFRITTPSGAPPSPIPPGPPRPPASPTAAPAPPTGPPIGDIVRYLDEQLVPIRTGRLGPVKAGTRGIFKPRAEVVRTREALDLDTIGHELGHAIDQKIGLVRSPSLGQATQFLMVNQSSYSAAALQRERVAEFVRTWLTDPATARRLAPQLTDDFERSLQLADPRWWKAMVQAQQDIAAWKARTPVDHVLGRLRFTNPETPQALNGWQRFQQQFVNELVPLQDVVARMTGGQPLDALADPVARAVRARGWGGRAQHWIQWGPVDDVGRPMKDAAGRPIPGLEEMLRVARGQEDAFWAFLVARQAQTWESRGLRTGFDEAKVRAIVGSTPPHLQALADRWVAYNNAVLDELVDGGMLAADAAARYKQRYPYYVSFQRTGFPAEARGPKPRGARREVNLPAPIRAARGSTMEILHPLESTMRRTIMALSLTSRNRVWRSLYDLARATQGAGREVEILPRQVVPVSFRLERLDQALADIGITNLTPAQLQQMMTIFMPRGPRGISAENIIAIWDAGTVRHVQVSPDLYQLGLRLNTDTANDLVRFFRPFTRAVRAGAVLTPNFWLRNLARDQVMAFINSNYGYVPVLSMLNGLQHVIRKSATYKQFYGAGGAQATLVGLDGPSLATQMRRLIGNETTRERAFRYATTPIEALRFISNAIEEATRVGEFAQAPRGTPQQIAEAAISARRLTLDYGQFGTSGRNFNAIAAFWNAWIQGLERIRIEAKEHPVRFTLKSAAAITLPTYYLYLLNRDDPEWLAAPRWRKDFFWHVRLRSGDPGLWIAKPFELGTVFGSIPERLLEALDGQHPEAFNDLTTTLRRQLVDQAIPVPNLILPMLEIAANYNFFTGRAIVPTRERLLPARLQVGAYTSTFARRAGEAAGVSPRLLEHALIGYTAGLGRVGLAIPEELGVLPQRPGFTARTTAERVPGVQGLLATPYAQSQDVEEFYRRLEEVEREIRGRQSEGALPRPLPRRNRARRAMIAADPQLQERQTLKRTADQLRELQEAIRETLTRTDLSATQKRFQIAAYNRQMVDAARSALQRRPLPAAR